MIFFHRNYRTFVLAYVNKPNKEIPMVRFTREQFIPAQPQEVWRVLGDYPNVYRWAPIVKESRQASSEATGVGAARTCSVPGFGEVTETVETWSEGKGFSFTWAASGPMKGGRSTWTLSREGSGSRVRAEIEAQPRYGILGQLLVPVFKPMMARMISDALRGLEHHVQTGQVVDSVVAKKLGLKAA